MRFIVKASTSGAPELGCDNNANFSGDRHSGEGGPLLDGAVAGRVAARGEHRVEAALDVDRPVRLVLARPPLAVDVGAVERGVVDVARRVARGGRVRARADACLLYTSPSPRD